MKFISKLSVVCMVFAVLIISLFNYNENIIANSPGVKAGFQINPGGISWKFEDSKKELNFGEFNVSEITNGSKEKRYDRFSNIIITDNRGTHEGFSMNIKGEQFVNSNDENNKLRPGTLILKRDAFSFENDGYEESYSGVNPNTNDIYLDDGVGGKMFNFEEGKGYGETSIIFNEKSVEMAIEQKNVKKGSYSTTVTFTFYPSIQT